MRGACWDYHSFKKFRCQEEIKQRDYVSLRKKLQLTFKRTLKKLTSLFIATLAKVYQSLVTGAVCSNWEISLSFSQAISWGINVEKQNFQKSANFKRSYPRNKDELDSHTEAQKSQFKKVGRWRCPKNEARESKTAFWG